MPVYSHGSACQDHMLQVCRPSMKPSLQNVAVNLRMSGSMCVRIDQTFPLIDHINPFWKEEMVPVALAAEELKGVDDVNAGI